MSLCILSLRNEKRMRTKFVFKDFNQKDIETSFFVLHRLVEPPTSAEYKVDSKTID